MLGGINLPQWRCPAELIDNSIDRFMRANRAGRPIEHPEPGPGDKNVKLATNLYEIIEYKPANGFLIAQRGGRRRSDGYCDGWIRRL